MDFFSHVLTANLGGIYLSAKNSSIKRYPIIIAGVIPDIGEIIIQNHLSRKFGTEFGVYDARTSDISKESNRLKAPTKTLVAYFGAMAVSTKTSHSLYTQIQYRVCTAGAKK